MKRNLSIISIISIFVMLGFLTQCDENVAKGEIQSQSKLKKDNEINDVIYKFDHRKQTAEVISYSDKTATKIILPSNVKYEGKEYVVTSIEIEAFKDCPNLVSLTMPDSLRNFPNYGNYGCKDRLEEITLSKNLLDCSDLKHFPNLKRIIVSEDHPVYSVIDGVLFNKDKTMLCQYPRGKSGAYSIPAGVERINEYAFSECSLTSVDIPGNVKEIGRFAFYKSNGIKSIHISNGVSIIGHRAFDHALNFDTLYIPASVRSIESFTFAGNSQLKAFIVDKENKIFSSEDGVLFDKGKSLIIKYPDGKSGSYTTPATVTRIGDGAFEESKIESITITSNVDGISRDAFSFCESLSSITFNEGLKYIDHMAFLNCDKVVSIILPNSLESIGDEVFSQCYNLKELYIGKNVSDIDMTAFTNCDKLEEYIVSEENSKYSSEDGMLFDKSKSELLNCPTAKRVCRIPASVKNISAFFENAESFIVSDENENYSSDDGVLFDKLKTQLILFPARKTGKYTIPDSVYSIAKYAFDRCDVKSISIPASVLRIEENAFYHCSKLESIEVSKDNKYYSSEDGVLYDKAKEKMLKYPENKRGLCKLSETTESINFSNGDYKIEDIIIPSKVKHCLLGSCRDSLKTLTFEAEKPMQELSQVLKFARKHTIIYVPEGSIEMYEAVVNKERYKIDGRLTVKAIEKK